MLLSRDDSETNDVICGRIEGFDGFPAADNADGS